MRVNILLHLCICSRKLTRLTTREHCTLDGEPGHMDPGQRFYPCQGGFT
jgi:hypothetical protein